MKKFILFLKSIQQLIIEKKINTKLNTSIHKKKCFLVYFINERKKKKQNSFIFMFVYKLTNKSFILIITHLNHKNKQENLLNKLQKNAIA